jgi:hypothetical protein
MEEFFMYLTSDVFGVSNSNIESYIERKSVDERFINGIDNNKHIIVYGSSKQGKTALTIKHLNENDFIRINCSTSTREIDIYSSILRQCGFEFKVSREEVSSGGVDGNLSVNAKVKVPAFGEFGIGSKVGQNINETEKKTFRQVEYNLMLPQDISEILKSIAFNKRIILENFHYLPVDVQEQLAFDLRVFEDYNILFIILGIWREKNRLAQFNGDLQDRLIEIPVEPWMSEDFKRVASEGEPLLGVCFDDVIDYIISHSFNSIGVFQEICKESCIAAGVEKTNVAKPIYIEESHVNKAIEKKIETYSSRHIRSIEAFVEQKAKSSSETPLYLAYYFVNVLLQSEFSDIKNGFRRNFIRDEIRKIHHRPDDVRSSDLSYFLHNIVESQIKKKIIPPLFDYDRSVRILKVIDSTLFFFLKNYDLNDLLDEIEQPLELK